MSRSLVALGGCLLAFAATQRGFPGVQPPVRPRSHAPSTRGSAADAPLSERERALQLLDRFTFGARPGEVDQVLAMGPDRWLEQQMDTNSAPDVALNKRLAEYTTLNMSPAQALELFPDRGTIQAVAEGKRPYPADPQIKAVYDVQVAKYLASEGGKKTTAGAPVAVPPTAEEMAAKKAADQATATRVAGELFALPREARMAALLRLPVEERIAFSTYVGGEQKNLLLAQFTARERELFFAMNANVGASGRIVAELAEAKVLRAVLGERQLEEVMTDFWFNHFNVFAGKDSDQWYTTSYERDVIRRHALGRFGDLLAATATSPAMLIYLDNWQSIGPNSLANGVNPAKPGAKKGNKGLNENYGRELMELHTLSVNGGYSQADVTALSAILTGWTVDRPNQGGPFLFDQRRHEPGDKRWLGQTIREGHDADGAPAGVREGQEALATLARSPRTAHFICFLLAQRFVADDPPAALVDRLTTTYLSTDGDIRAIVRALAQSPEFNSHRYFRNKVKTPLEYVASVFRATGTEPTNPAALVTTLRNMGMPLFYALPPTGYYITADRWMNSDAIVDRLNFADTLTRGKYPNQRFDAAHLLALSLMLQPTAGLTHSAQLGERPASTSPRRQSAVEPVAVATEKEPGNSGRAVAVRLLERTVLGVNASPKTSRLIDAKLADASASSGTVPDDLNTATALILGSPDFQLR